MPSVLIVDDNLLAREGLKHMLSQEHRNLTFGEATTGEEAASRLARRPWDVAVIEISLPGADGYQILQNVRRSHPAVRVLMLSPQISPEHSARARHLRASGYTGKNTSRAELLRAFHNVLAGKEHFAGAPLERVSEAMPSHAALSARERDVLLACVAGKRIGEIAAELHLSIKTVSTYKRRILDKLRLNSVAELVRHAIDHHLC